MPFLPSESRLFERVYGEPALAELFSDERLVGLFLGVEAALARVQGELGIIPKEAAAAIGALRGFTPDWEALARQTERDGVPIAALVAQLRARLEPHHAPYLHRGATTQDILDTALVLQLRAALGLLEDKLRRTLRALAALAHQHRHTLMAGRTHAQQALPITFGFKVAGWMAPLLRDLERLGPLRERLLVVQMGGAVGTLAALGEEGVRVMEGLARELGLGIPPLPWHTARDNLAELAGWLSLVSGSLAKMAQDIILLAQSEVGELRESAEADRGGSSTLPQKSNPVMSEAILASARANAALLSAVHQALVAEHERATHGWQLEWLTLPQMLSHTAAALNQARHLGEGMVVNAEQMRANVRASRGLMLAEAISFALAEHMDRAQATALVREAARVALSEGRHLTEVVRERVSFPLDWEALGEERYLGSSQPFIERVLEEAERILGGSE
jgi:3-carboxy-cis,cis-muconate cycloisomerase